MYIYIFIYIWLFSLQPTTNTQLSEGPSWFIDCNFAASHRRHSCGSCVTQSLNRSQNKSCRWKFLSKCFFCLEPYEKLDVMGQKNCLMSAIGINNSWICSLYVQFLAECTHLPTGPSSHPRRLFNTLAHLPHFDRLKRRSRRMCPSFWDKTVDGQNLANQLISLTNIPNIPKD